MTRDELALLRILAALVDLANNPKESTVLGVPPYTPTTPDPVRLTLTEP